MTTQDKIAALRAWLCTPPGMPGDDARKLALLDEIAGSYAELLAAADALLRGVSENGKLQPWLARLGSAANHARFGKAPPA